VTAENVTIADLPPLAEGLFCLDCGYDLRGSTNASCPECGFSLELLRSGESQIPWSHRREIGRFRAYWKTVWLVIRWPKRFCSEIARPVSYRDAQSFRWIIVVQTYITFLLASALTLAVARSQAWFAGPFQAEILLWLLGGLQLFVVLMLIGMPWIASHVYQTPTLPPEQQRRAAALSYYTDAPLAAAPLGIPLLIASLIPGLSGTLAQAGLFIGVACVLCTLWILSSLLGIQCTICLVPSQAERRRRYKAVSRIGAFFLLLATLLPVSIFWAVLIWESLR
jgi:hypothetical protein